jgi:hypothetical protein
MELVRALMMLSARLRSRHQLDRALEVSSEAQRILTDVGAMKTEADSVIAANYLINYANVLVEAGRHEQADTASSDAVAAWRSLVSRNPSAHLPGLATALAARAFVLRDSDLPGAIAMMRESVGLWGDLADRNPVLHHDTWIRSLRDLAMMLDSAGQYEQAQIIREAFLNDIG